MREKKKVVIMLHSENVIYCPLWKHDRSCLCHHWHFPYQSSNWGKLRQQSIASRNKMGYQMNTRIRLSIISEEGKKIDHPHYCEQKLPIDMLVCANWTMHELYAKVWLILIAIETRHHHPTRPPCPWASPPFSLSYDWFHWKGNIFCVVGNICWSGSTIISFGEKLKINRTYWSNIYVLWGEW